MPNIKGRIRGQRRNPEEPAGNLGKGSVMAATGTATPKTTSGRLQGARGTTERPVLTGSQIVCRALEDEGVDTVFGYPGGGWISPCLGPIRAMGGARGRRVRACDWQARGLPRDVRSGRD
jgi:hypothetical protein